MILVGSVLWPWYVIGRYWDPDERPLLRANSSLEDTRSSVSKSSLTIEPNTIPYNPPNPSKGQERLGPLFRFRAT